MHYYFWPFYPKYSSEGFHNRRYSLLTFSVKKLFRSEHLLAYGGCSYPAGPHTLPLFPLTTVNVLCMPCKWSDPRPNSFRDPTEFKPTPKRSDLRLINRNDPAERSSPTTVYDS